MWQKCAFIRWIQWNSSRFYISLAWSLSFINYTQILEIKQLTWSQMHTIRYMWHTFLMKSEKEVIDRLHLVKADRCTVVFGPSRCTKVHVEITISCLSGRRPRRVERFGWPAENRQKYKMTVGNVAYKFVAILFYCWKNCNHPGVWFNIKHTSSY